MPPAAPGALPTLVVSDLHLGMPAGRDLLRTDRAVRAALVRSLAGIGRLVLLGDVIELRHGPAAEAVRLAGPVLAELGEALGGQGEVVLVPGNHDHHLLDASRERAPMEPMGGLSAEIDWRPEDRIAALVRFLAPARVRVSYPGVWLRDDVFALHGHQLDVHTTVPMFERLAAGAMVRAVRRLPHGPRRVEDYEGLQAPIYAWIHAVAQTGGPPLGRSSHGTSAGAWRALRAQGGGARRGRLARARGTIGPAAMRARALRSSFALTVAALNRAGIGPLRARLGPAELRRASLIALAEALERLDVGAASVIFGHTHRAGPMRADAPTEWRGRHDQQLINTGCWVHEPAFLGREPARSPYRPGFAVRLSGAGPPELVNLLDRAGG